MQDDGYAGLHDLPRRLAAGEAAAEDVDGLLGHGVRVAQDARLLAPVGPPRVVRARLS